MAQHYFTPEEANEALGEIRPLVEQLVEHSRALAEAQVHRTALAERISGNGGGIQPSELAEATAEVEEQATGIARCIRSITEHGALVKDLEEGLVDFPALRGDEEILLCWKLGEEDVAYWHGADEGFAGRRPLSAE